MQRLIFAYTTHHTHPLFLVMGITFSVQDTDGTLYALKNGSYNALAIVKVSGV